MDRLTLFHLRQANGNCKPQSQTERDQIRTELLVQKAVKEKLEKWGESAMRLFKIEHINYLIKSIANLPSSIEHLDASQPWLVYWMVHAMRLLNYQIPTSQVADIIQLVRSCQVSVLSFALLTSIIAS